MAVKLLFNPSGTGNIEPIVKTPTLVIAKKSGEKLGAIPSTNIRFECNLNSANTIDFKVYKTRNGVNFERWDEVKDFRLLWVKEWDMWFEMHIDTTQSNSLEKNVNCTAIGEAELSVIRLYNIEINTENDIDRADYVQTVLYNELNPDGSLLHRILEKAPHYTIKHVDESIANIQRMFTFDDTSIHDAFSEISEEIGCLFILSQNSGDDGLPERGIYVYDLMSHCNVCGHRDDHFATCPNCGSTNVEDGFGKDTGIFISNENIAKEITLTTDTDNVFNCFKLEAGDDDITSAVANLNPNGSDYIWYFPEHTTSDMSDELSQKIAEYNTEYNYYQTEYEFTQSETLLDGYNALIRKYAPYNDNLEEIDSLIGFDSSTEALYSAIDFELYLTSGLVPSIEMSDTDATEQASLLTASALSPVAVTNLNYASHSTVDMNVLFVAKTIVRPTYKVEIIDSEYDSTTHIWTGSFTVTNYSYDDDIATTEEITITITDNYATYIKQKINNVLNRGDSTDYSVTELFNKSLIVEGDTFTGDFADEIKKYCLSMLSSFHNSCQSCLDVLVEEGISDSSIWSGQQEDLYNSFYQKYYQRLQALENEISVRDSEIELIKQMYVSIIDERGEIQNTLNLKNYIGDTLWKEFCSFRRESTYSNSNYISDGLNNTEVLQLAEDFLKVARSELIKSSTMQHSISSSLSNLLLYDGEEFKKLVDSFNVGNWLRIKIDGEIYQLRLISYAIDFDNLEEIDVEFSDVLNCNDSISDIQSILKQASSMASTYQTVERQADKNSQTTKVVDTWFEDGLDATLTQLINDADSQTMIFNEHGFLLRSYDEISGNYSPEQLKIINSTLAVTDDNWVTTKTAIGKFLYFDPATGELKKAYGVNAETVIGKMILGRSLGIYNATNTLKFDDNGLNVTNGTNTFVVNPQATSVISLLNGNTPVLSVDENGNLAITGNITAISGKIGGFNISSTGNVGMSDDGGHVYTSSLYAHSSDGTYEYESGLKGDEGSSASQNSLFYVKRIISDARWDTAEDMFYVLNNGTLFARNADITGNINASSGRIGGFNITSSLNDGTSAVGGHCFTNSLYVHTSDSGYEYESGLKGETGAGTITFYVKRMTSGGNWANADYVYYVTNLGKLYATNAEITGKITAMSGVLGGFNITSSTNVGTSSQGGHFGTNSLYIHTTDGTYEYEAGLKADGSSGDSNFYVRRITSGSAWSSGEYMFYVTNAGALYANNATVRGDITATTLSAGNKLVYNGSTLSINGAVTATTFTAYGSNADTYTVIGDNITLYNSVAIVEPYFSIRTTTNSGTVVSKLTADSLTLNGASLTGGTRLTSSKTIEVPSLILTGTSADIYMDVSSSFLSIMRCYNGTLYFGAVSNLQFPNTHLRGEVVRLYTVGTGGGVYLGVSGSTAVTSDETLKDLYSIDDKFTDFFDKLNPVAYKYKVGHRMHLGFGAQSVEKALFDSGLGTEDFAGILIDKNVDISEDEKLSPDGKTHFDKLYSIRYEEFIALNTLMIQKLKKENSELSERINELERLLRR